MDQIRITIRFKNGCIVSIDTQGGLKWKEKTESE